MKKGPNSAPFPFSPAVKYFYAAPSSLFPLGPGQSHLSRTSLWVYLVPLQHGKRQNAETRRLSEMSVRVIVRSAERNRSAASRRDAANPLLPALRRMRVGAANSASRMQRAVLVAAEMQPGRALHGLRHRQMDAAMCAADDFLSCTVLRLHWRWRWRCDVVVGGGLFRSEPAPREVNQQCKQQVFHAMPRCSTTSSTKRLPT